MSRRVSLAVVALVPGLLVLGALSAAGSPQRVPPKITAIKAVFSEPKRQTTYSVRVLGRPRPQVSYRWHLFLSRVDNAVGRDPDCKNHGVKNGYFKKFVWHHGNKGDPVSDDGCDHTKMGKYGHQGKITVRVSSKQWKCFANYKGTNSSSANRKAGLEAASKPHCIAVKG